MTSALVVLGLAACSSVAGIELGDQGLDRFTAGDMDPPSDDDATSTSGADPEGGTDGGTAGPPGVTGFGGGTTDGGSSTGDDADGTGTDDAGSDDTGTDDGIATGGTTGDTEASTGGPDDGAGDPGEPVPEPPSGSTGGEPPDVGTTGT